MRSSSPILIQVGIDFHNPKITLNNNMQVPVSDEISGKAKDASVKKLIWLQLR